MTKGQLVTVRLYGGITAKRRVVAVKRDVIVVCVEQEYEAAEREGREPTGLGFPYEDVVESGAAKKDVRRETNTPLHSQRAGD